MQSATGAQCYPAAQLYTAPIRKQIGEAMRVVWLQLTCSLPLKNRLKFVLFNNTISALCAIWRWMIGRFMYYKWERTWKNRDPFKVLFRHFSEGKLRRISVRLGRSPGRALNAGPVLLTVMFDPRVQGISTQCLLIVALTEARRSFSFSFKRSMNIPSRYPNIIFLV
jgi:hypothetical protein